MYQNGADVFDQIGCQAEDLPEVEGVRVGKWVRRGGTKATNSRAPKYDSKAPTVPIQLNDTPGTDTPSVLNAPTRPINAAGD